MSKVSAVKKSASEDKDSWKDVSCQEVSSQQYPLSTSLLAKIYTVNKSATICFIFQKVSQQRQELYCK
jgi:hypothetical protein